jgi:hypothetical protein
MRLASLRFFVFHPPSSGCMRAWLYFSDFSELSNFSERLFLFTCVSFQTAIRISPAIY